MGSQPHPLRIERAHAEQAAGLTALAHHSKAHWEYPSKWLERWTEQLTVTPEYIRDHPTYVAIDPKGEIVGFYALQGDGSVAWLDHLWVSPPAMRQGIGQALVLHAEESARAAGFAHLKIASDPHAEPFYQRMGATTIDHQQADMDGHPRLLPIMEKLTGMLAESD